MVPRPEEKLFRGDFMNGEKPHTWFRRLEGRFDDTTPLATKLYRFSKGLDPGRRAEKWFQALPAATKADWDLLYAAFTLRWPIPVVVEPSREELLTRLRATRLEEENLGVLMGDEDKIYSHVAWADEIRTLTDALEDDKGHLISEVRRQLPLTVRRILPGNLTTWSAFLTAVESISLDRLADEREAEERSQRSIVETLSGMGLSSTNNADPRNPKFTRTTPYSPQAPPPTYQARAPRAPPAATPAPTPPTTPTTVPTTPQYQPRVPWAERMANATPRGPPPNVRFNTPSRDSEPNPFLTPGATRPSSAFNRPPGTPQTPSRSRPTNEELAQRAVALTSTYPTTPEGIAQYQVALQAWEAAHAPLREVDFTTPPYPLTPGTVNIGSRECFRCGQRGHISRDCPETQHVNVREQRWRALIGRILFFSRTRTETAAVSQVNAEEPARPYDPAIYDASQLDFDDEYDLSGNGPEVRD